MSATQTFPKNERIVSVLSHLKLLRQLQGKEHSVKALENAIESVKYVPFEIFSGEQAKANIKIGDTVKKYIDNILSLNDPNKSGIPEIDNLPPDMFSKLILIMQMIKYPGVGIKTAEKYYNDGIRDINTFKQIIENKGTTRQQIGMKYKNELEKRIPRNKVEVFVNNFNILLNNYNNQNGTIIRYDVCGSYRREKETSGDIDIILWSFAPTQAKNYFSNFINYLGMQGLLKDTLSLGEDSYQGIGYIDNEYPSVRVDFKVLGDLTEYYFATLYFTGSVELNEQMREKAKSMGLLLGNTKMKIISTGQNIYVRNEKDIFDILSIEYKEPKNR